MNLCASVQPVFSARPSLKSCKLTCPKPNFHLQRGWEVKRRFVAKRLCQGSACVGSPLLLKQPRMLNPKPARNRKEKKGPWILSTFRPKANPKQNQSNRRNAYIFFLLFCPFFMAPGKTTNTTQIPTNRKPWLSFAFPWLELRGRPSSPRRRWSGTATRPGPKRGLGLSDRGVLFGGLA